MSKLSPLDKDIPIQAIMIPEEHSSSTTTTPQDGHRVIRDATIPCTARWSSATGTLDVWPNG